MNKNTKQRQKLFFREKTKGNTVISQNLARNMQECVYHNKVDGKSQSATKHESINPDKPFRPYKRKEKRNFFNNAEE